MTRRVLLPLLFALLLSAGTVSRLEAKSEHFGGRFEIMNLAGVNLYGFGTYSHTRWVDVEMMFYFSPRALSFLFLNDNREYISDWAAFSFKFRPLEFGRFRKSDFHPYVGAGNFPFILRGYTMHLTVGVEWEQKENFAFDLNVKRIFTREAAPFNWLPGEGSSKAGLWALCLGVRL